MNTTEVENYPGFPSGIMGPELMGQIRSQAERFGAELVSDDAISVELESPVKTVRTLSGEFTADAVVLAVPPDVEVEADGRGSCVCWSGARAFQYVGKV